MRAASAPMRPCARVESPAHRGLQLRVARHQPRADRAEAMPRIELIERAPQHLVTTRAPRRALADALAQRRRQLGDVAAAHREASFEAGIIPAVASSTCRRVSIRRSR